MAPRSQSKKAHLCCLKQRALVYDTTFDSYTIKTNEKIRENYEDYWSFQLGPPRTRADSWDLFLNEKADRAIAIGTDRPPKDAIFIAGLQLSKLGVWGRLLRRTGVLNNGYIIRPQTSLS
ncbi:hypothetical protein F4824DRAFT_191570 [Ustulina deusta]|nr:hypothetical protein F4823DRAFT_560326 [Ustulina deusta]KAI3342132.1 hypothetical protein F4824DRAFT_191570 [Ustulina deusta]